MSGRLIAQVLVSVGTVVGRAFIAAYKQAAANAAQGGGPAAAARGSAKEGTVDALTRKTGLSLEEACQILNVNKDVDLTQLTKNYDHLFKVNNAAEGGSFYLQSKVVRAKERLDMERGDQVKTPDTQTTTPASNDAPASTPPA
ncbi:Pam16-domain-containing protein [Spinellus fusiger]|nr:Pam16-domain-containing protein [Spinellus fusiger]